MATGAVFGRLRKGAVALIAAEYPAGMNLQAQIELITSPQDFTRLCNAVLQAEYGADFLSIDDDRADRGNDGYLRSEKQMFAAHCFKRIQNKGLDAEIRSKMLSDLKKAVGLRDRGDWEVLKWTFLSNYPIPERVASEVNGFGLQEGIDVSWLGPGYFATELQKFASVRELFPNLMGNEVMARLDEISGMIESLSLPIDDPLPVVTWIPRSAVEQAALVHHAPAAWEYLLFAGVLLQGKERLEPKWRDFRTGYGRRRGIYFDERSGGARLTAAFGDMEAIVQRLMHVFPPSLQAEAFGPPGVPGNSDAIIHIGERIISTYDEILNWAAEIRGEVYPENLKRLAGLAANMAIRPAEDIRNFIDRVVFEISQVPDRIARADPRIEISLTLTVTADEEIVREFSKETKRATKRIHRGW